VEGTPEAAIIMAQAPVWAAAEALGRESALVAAIVALEAAAAAVDSAEALVDIEDTRRHTPTTIPPLHPLLPLIIIPMFCASRNLSFRAFFPFFITSL